MQMVMKRDNAIIKVE